MATREMLNLTEAQIAEAAGNYIDCLNLVPGNQVLIVADRLPDNGDTLDFNTLVRREVTDKIRKNLSKDGYVLETVELDHDMSEEEMFSQTKLALDGLDQSTDKSLTVVYMGDTWKHRRGMYDAINEFAETRDVGIAASLGFSTGDCRVMSQMTEKRRQTIVEASKYFENFFDAYAKGRFNITTTDASGDEYRLELDYDTSQVDFHVDMGRFDDKTGKTRNYKFVNIPGGETYSSPYPFANTHGRFAAEGLVFSVEKGLVIDIEVSDEVWANMTEVSQVELVERVRSGQKIPVVELGLGFYEMAGIETFNDSSVLSREKGGPHIGMGKALWETPDGEVMAELARDFHHTDFVMGKVEIDWLDLETHEARRFYPLEK